jgi:Flp pilus assembly pilin Flp
MQAIVKSLRRFLGSTEGATAIECAVILSMIVVVCLFAIEFFGTSTSTPMKNTTFHNVSNNIGGK